MEIITLIFVVGLVIFIVSRFNKGIQSYTESELSTVFLRIDINYKDLINNSFVKHRILPYLSKHGYPPEKIEQLKKQRKKDLEEIDKKWEKMLAKMKSGPSRIKYSDQDIENQVWSTILNELIDKQIHKYGEDKSLSFRILNNGSRENALLWDSLYKDFDSTDEITFYLNLVGEGSALDESLELRGKTVFKQRGEQRYRILIVYFFIHPELSSNEKWEDNVGILGELPYDFLHPQRYEFLGKREESVAGLLKLFDLKEYKEDHKGDFGGPNELGEHFSIGKPGFTIGTDYVEFWII